MFHCIDSMRLVAFDGSNAYVKVYQDYRDFARKSVSFLRCWRLSAARKAVRWYMEFVPEAERNASVLAGLSSRSSS